MRANTSQLARADRAAYARSMRCALVPVLMLAACAHDAGGWPTLAPRPAERRSIVPDPPYVAAPVAPAPTEPIVAGDPAAPIDWAKLRPRIGMAESALAHSLATAAQARLDSGAWANAEVELSRAEQLLGDLNDLIPRFGTNAGTPLAPTDVLTGRATLSRRIEAGKRALAR